MSFRGFGLFRVNNFSRFRLCREPRRPQKRYTGNSAAGCLSNSVIRTTESAIHNIIPGKSCQPSGQHGLRPAAPEYRIGPISRLRPSLNVTSPPAAAGFCPRTVSFQNPAFSEARCCEFQMAGKCGTDEFPELPASPGCRPFIPFARGAGSAPFRVIFYSCA
jgi:hypothetical protein